MSKKRRTKQKVENNNPNNIALQKEEEIKKLKNEIQKLQNDSESLRKQELRLLDKKTELETKGIELSQKSDNLKKAEELFKQKENNLEKREKEYISKLKSFDNESEKLRKREQKVIESEIKRDAGFTKERKELDDALQKRRSDFDNEISESRITRTTELDNELAKERKSRLANLEKELKNEREKVEKELNNQKTDFKNWVNDERVNIEKIKGELNKKEQNQLSKQDDLDYKDSRLQSREDALDQRENDIEHEVIEITKARELSFNEESESYKKEIERLNNSISNQREVFGVYDELKQKLGGEEPEKVLFDFNSKIEENKILKEELLTRPTQEMREKYDEYKNENSRLTSKNEELQENYNQVNNKFKDQKEIELQLHELTKEKESLERQNASINASNIWLEEELKRLQSSFQRKQEKEARIKEVEAPYLTKREDLIRAEKGIDELEWLNNIENKCKEYGFKFHPRILKSFHTALKTAEFSPLTILSGVSGTGKSELPRLYSYFGGINFLSLAVQPNWDSPESMLGFFNSIDNKFDAQPVLRLLAQSQKEQSKDYPGLYDVMTLILLDEMNLAHVELYFSEFLSKLEQRRGKGKKDVPSVDVKLGAGIEPYKLPLGRNILWAGTMNQDETTKSLSDKVLDRGIEIHFPRPTSFERMKEMKLLEKVGKAPLLSRIDWNKWWNTKSQFTEEQIKPYKSFIEEMNKYLANAGRALGHRVWQSIEYYMANYPGAQTAQRKEDDIDLKKIMRVAFEDQLVQKVMPKLRGIETRGKSKTECLDKIKAQLVDDEYSIIDDFDFACEYGYGQFMWNSAKYLQEKADEKKGKEDTDEEEKLDNGNSIKDNITKKKDSQEKHDAYEELDKKKVSELKQMCKDSGLSIKGKKSDLIIRLREIEG